MLRFLLASVVVFLAFNVIACWQLVRLHPRRKPAVIAIAVLCNLMWLFFPILNARTDFSRAVRAILGPPWFGWLCFITIYCAFLLIIFVAWIPFHRQPWRRFARWPSRIILWSSIVLLIVGVYTALVPLDIERVPITLDNLPPELNGTRIALIADLHTGLFTRSSRLRQIFTTTASLSPDVVLLAGDLVDDDPYFVAKLLDSTRALPPTLPLVGVLGNHEMYGQPFEVIRRLRGSRVHLLVNEGTALKGFWFAGLSDYAASIDALKPNFELALAQKPADAFPIVVAHQPRAFPEAQKRALPLTLCAHSHGGQLGFRPLRWSLAGLFLPYHMGLYRRGGSQVYVNTGTGYWLLPWRLGVTPEITLVELRSTK
ncbi:MAG TPA: metallophosphoesterase [Thermoanaerobaculia bacterium]